MQSRSWLGGHEAPQVLAGLLTPAAGGRRSAVMPSPVRLFALFSAVLATHPNLYVFVEE